MSCHTLLKIFKQLCLIIINYENLIVILRLSFSIRLNTARLLTKIGGIIFTEY